MGIHLFYRLYLCKKNAKDMKRIIIIMLMSAISGLAFAQSADKADTDSSYTGQRLKEVVVTATIAPYKISKGGVTVKVSGTTLSDAGTCFDVLTQMPGARDVEGNIEIAGKGSPQIYINGRRMYDRSELSRLSSKEIQSVEMVYNPGAKYGADVKAVILIKTVRKQGDGLSGSVQASGRKAHSFSQGDNLSLNYRTGGVDIFGSIAFDHSRRYQEQRNITSINTGKERYSLDADMTLHPVSTDASGNLGINWQINSQHSIGARYEYSATPYSKSRWMSDERIGMDGSVLEVIDADTYWNRRSLPTNWVNLYYAGKVKSMAINIVNDYYARHTNSAQTINESSTTGEVHTIVTNNSISNRLWASKGTATYRFGNNELEFGYEFTSTDRRDRFINREEALGNADDHIKESCIAGFVSVNVPVRNVELYAGLRYEHTVSDYYMYSRLVPEQSRRYARFYPGFDFTFPINRANFTLSYTSKTKRPLYSQLSSAIQYDDRFTYETGNPCLVSEMIHDISLAGVWKRLFFSVGWQYDADAIISTIKPFKEGSPVNLMSYDNFHHLSKYSIVISFSPKVGRWSPRIRANLLGQDFDLGTRSGNKSMNTPLLFWNCFNTVNLGQGFNVSADVSGRTRGDMDVVTLKPSWQINVGVSKSMKDWFFQLQATDLFKTTRNSMITFGEQMTLDKWNYSDTRALRLIVRYSFNATMSKYKGRSVGMSERNRL